MPRYPDAFGVDPKPANWTDADKAQAVRDAEDKQAQIEQWLADQQRRNEARRGVNQS
jgi:hypothetical protein